MADRHLHLLRAETLCGAFLSAAMIMTGCAHKQTKADTTPLPPDPNNTLTLGEENLHEAIRFSQIDRHGDLRIKRIVARMRQSSLGEEMYQYLVDHKIEFQWESGRKDRKGAYYFDKKLIVVDINHSDDGVLSTLSHEIRHAWQDNTLDIVRWDLDPIGKWQAWQFMEADSCAFNAHFIAEYKRETGQTISPQSNFSHSVTKDYAEKLPHERNYTRDALEPCFKLVIKNYQDEHLEVLRAHQKRYTEFFNQAAASGHYKNALRYHFDPATPDEKAVLFMRFMNLTLDPQKALPATSRESFLQWIEGQSSYKDPKDETEITSMQAEFQRMREHMVRELK